MKLKSIFHILMIGLWCTPFQVWSAGMPLKGAIPMCKDVISQQETQKGIPQGLLKAIAAVESGISPWAVNAHGHARIFRSKEAAAKYVRELVESGTGNFSVGCMQLHYASHRRYFKSIEAMLEPENNIAHAAKLIKNLERRHGSMDRAVKLYHSSSPAHHNPYKNRVYGMWAKFGGGYLESKKANNGSLLKPVTLKAGQKKAGKAPKRSTKIKFGVGAASLKKNKNQKV